MEQTTVVDRLHQLALEELGNARAAEQAARREWESTHRQLLAQVAEAEAMVQFLQILPAGVIERWLELEKAA